MAIKRIWHGWTTPENAAAYENLLRDEVFPGIEAKQSPGYRGIELLRLDRDGNGDGEVEVVTIMTCDTIQNVIDVQGPDYRRCYVPDAAQKLLKRWDPTSDHYEVKETRDYG